MMLKFSVLPKVCQENYVYLLKLVCQPRLVTKYSDKIIVHAKSLKEQLEANGVNGKKINVIPHFDYGYLLFRF